MTDVGAGLTELIIETFRLNGRLLSAGDALVAKLGLSSARWQVLGAVALSPVPLNVAQIARNMGLARQSVQRLVNEMERDKLVRFETNPHHRRAKFVALTPRGRSAYDAADERQRPWALRLADGVSAKRIAAATELLRILRTRLEESAPARE